MPETKVARYCPKCGARASAPETAFSKPQKCPRCQTVVTFEKIQSSPPRKVDAPELEHSLTPFDYAAYTAIGIGLFSAVCALICLLLGYGSTASFLAFALLVLGVFPIAAFAMTRSAHTKAIADAKLARQQVRTLTEENAEAHRKWRLFEEELSRLVADERVGIHGEVESRRAEAESMVEFANNREKTIDSLGKRFLSDTVKWVSAKLTGQNFTTQRDRLTKAIEFCRKHEYKVDRATEEQLLAELRLEYEAVLRKEHAKAEQARIKARIREEQKAERELQREMARIEAEQKAIQRALDEALEKAAGQHTAEIEALELKLAEAIASGQRAMSMAQQTRAGHIYVISNVGSFGEGVFKVGMTRRLEPMDRVKELGDASVPFPFDVHMMISCDDAPKLENTLHKALHRNRLNRVNLRKEYFRTDIDTIHRLVTDNHGEVDYVIDPEALEYNESISMSEDDFVALTQAQEAVGVISDEDDDQ